MIENIETLVGEENPDKDIPEEEQTFAEEASSMEPPAPIELDEEDIPIKNPSAVEVCKCRFLNVRKAPNKNAEILKVVPFGKKFTLNGVSAKGWACITSDDIPKGYVLNEYLKEQ